MTKIINVLLFSLLVFASCEEDNEAISLMKQSIEQKDITHISSIYSKLKEKRDKLIKSKSQSEFNCEESVSQCKIKNNYKKCFDSLPSINRMKHAIIDRTNNNATLFNKLQCDTLEDAYKSNRQILQDNIDKTKDDVLRRIENSLDSLGISQASFFMAWTISSYEEYLSIMKNGGYYEGAMRAKERGLIRHICFATHCTPEDTIKIIREGAFEGVTINYSVLNHDRNRLILAEAEKYHIGVATMSSMATGTIPKNPDFFRFLKMDNDASIGQAALRFVAAQSSVSTTLAGVSTIKQLEENVAAFIFFLHRFFR